MYGAVYVRFGGEVDHAVGLVAFKYPGQCFRIEDVDLLKNVIGFVLDIAQVLEVAGIS